MKNLSTLDVARQAGISRATLERWIADKKIPSPKMIQFGRDEFRNWTAKDVERVRKYKENNYRKGRGRKAKPKR
jgi:excisionase family DNA binding protein